MFLRLLLPAIAGAVAAWPLGKAYNAMVLAGFGVIACFSSWWLIADKRPFALRQMFWIFCLVFLGIIPSFQYRFQSFPWDVPVSTQSVLHANLLILCCMGVYALAYQLYDLKFDPPVRRLPYTIRWGNGTTLSFLLAAMVLVVLIGPKNLWHRIGLDEAQAQYNQTYFLLLSGICRAWLILCFFTAIVCYKQGTMSKPMILFLLAVMLITHFPLAVNRTYLALLWGGAILLYARVWQRWAWLFRSAIILALLVLFPLTNQLRFLNSNSKYKAHDTEEAIVHSFAGGDFDAYANLTHTLRYVKKEGPTGGKQLLSALLFFVPRSVWPQKSVGSGYFIYEHYHSNFRNVSSPLIAEGYINFGLWGSLLFVALFAIFTKHWDRRGSEGATTNTMLASLLYPVLLMWSFFFLRGDMMSSFAVLSTFVVAALVWRKLLVCRVAQ